MPIIEIESRFWSRAIRTIKRITKRMLQAGGPKITWTIEEGEEVDIFNLDGDKIGKDTTLLIDFSDLTPALPDGWRLVGVIEHGVEYNVVCRVPGESHDMTQYVDAPPRCDHCNTKRARAKTYILERRARPDGGGWFTVGLETKQVGSTCIRDFFGYDLGYLLRCTTQLIKAVDPDEMRTKGGPLVMSIDIYLDWVAFIIRVGGWVSNKDAKLQGVSSTSNLVVEALTSPGGKKFLLASLDVLDETEPSKTDKKNAAAARKWAAGMTAPSSEWSANINNMAKQDYFSVRRGPYVASIISGYYISLRRKAERKEEYEILNEYLEVPLRSRATLPNVKVIYHRPLDTAWGPMQLYKFVTEDNRIITWFSSRDMKLKIDQVITLKGTVKKQSEYEGRRETVLTRCIITT